MNWLELLAGLELLIRRWAWASNWVPNLYGYYNAVSHYLMPSKHCRKTSRISKYGLEIPYLIIQSLTYTSYSQAIIISPLLISSRKHNANKLTLLTNRRIRQETILYGQSSWSFVSNPFPQAHNIGAHFHKFIYKAVFKSYLQCSTNKTGKIQILEPWNKQ